MISVIIPALNEDNNIRCCIESIKAEDSGCEIIVSDGGSKDKTVEKAGMYEGVKVISGSKGRGLQMNKGASFAKGEILLFLHADTTLEKGWSREIISALSDDTITGGAFAFRIKSAGIKYRLIEKWVEMRSGLFKLPYGDQGIFVRRRIFERLGGYREIPLMEDVDMIEGMKKLGHIAILRKRAFTNERKWAEHGVVSTSLRNQAIMLMYRLGMNPHKLARIYYRGK